MNDRGAEGPSRLIVGGKMHCPRCRRLQSVVAYRPLRMTEHFSDELNPILRCPSCNWLFSPALTLQELEQIASSWVAEMEPGKRSEALQELLETAA